MKLVISAWWFPVGVPVYLARAARRLGHEVVTLGPTAGAHLWDDADPKYARSWEKHVVVPDVPVDSERPGGALNEAGLERLFAGGNADLWLDVDGGWIARGLYTRGFAKRRVLICTDPHLPSELARAREFAMPDENGESPVDAVYMMQLAQCEPQRGEFWLPYGFDPEWHRPFDDVPQEYDVTVLGAPYPGRMIVADHLRRHGLRVYGPGRGPIAEDYARALCAAPVAVVWPLSDDVPARLYEALACERIVVTRLATPNPIHAAENTGRLLRVVTMNGLVDRVRYALTRLQKPESRERWAKFMAEDSWDARVKSLLAEQCP